MIACLLLGAGSVLILSGRHQWPGALCPPALYCGGLFLGISTSTAYGFWTATPGRYGLAIVPLLGLALAGELRSRLTASLLWRFGVLTLGLSFFFHVRVADRGLKRPVCVIITADARPS